MRVRQIKNSTITLNNASLMVNMKLIFFHLIPLVDLVEPMRLFDIHAVVALTTASRNFGESPRCLKTGSQGNDSLSSCGSYGHANCTPLPL